MFSSFNKAIYLSLCETGKPHLKIEGPKSVIFKPNFSFNTFASSLSLYVIFIIAYRFFFKIKLEVYVMRWIKTKNIY